MFVTKEILHTPNQYIISVYWNEASFAIDGGRVERTDKNRSGNCNSYSDDESVAKIDKNILAYWL